MDREKLRKGVDFLLSDEGDKKIQKVRSHASKSIIAGGVGLTTTAVATGMILAGQPEIGAATLLATGVYHFEQRRQLKNAKKIADQILEE